MVSHDANFSDEQHQLAEVSGDLFGSVNPTARLRELWDGEAPRDRKVWQQLAELGLTGIGVPGRHGGMDGGPADLVMVLEQAGRHLLPEPLADTVAVIAPTLVEGGGDLAATWLPRIAAGDAIGALSFDGMPHVLDVDEADLILVERQNTVWIAEAVPDAQRIRSEDGSRRRFRRPKLTGTMLGGTELLEDARTRAIAASAAQLVGVMDAMVEQCVAYAKVRQQFGTPIGAFQAVQHKLASMFVLVESARGASRHAARVLHRGDDARHAAHVAKAAAADAHRVVNAEALQIFAGIGFTWEHDLHLWLKRGLALEVEHGGAREHRRALVALLLD